MDFLSMPPERMPSYSREKQRDALGYAGDRIGNRDGGGRGLLPPCLLAIRPLNSGLS